MRAVGASIPPASRRPWASPTRARILKRGHPSYAPRDISAMFSSAGSFSGQNRRHGFGQYFNVKDETLGFDILHVEFHLAGKINLAASADLPETSDAGFCDQAAAVGEGETRHFAVQP